MDSKCNFSSAICERLQTFLLIWYQTKLMLSCCNDYIIYVNVHIIRMHLILDLDWRHHFISSKRNKWLSVVHKKQHVEDKQTCQQWLVTQIEMATKTTKWKKFIKLCSKSRRVNTKYEKTADKYVQMGLNKIFGHFTSNQVWTKE